MNPILTKSYIAGAAVNPCRAVKAGSSDNAVIQATDGSASIVGVTAENLAAASGQTVDVHKVGLAYIELGDTVTRGQYLKADSVGRGVPVTIVAGTPVYVIGRAECSGAVGEIIPVHVLPIAIANDTAIAQVDVTIATGELLALNATPKELVAAPGSGYAVIPVDLQLFLDYNSAAYAGIASGENLEVRHTDGSGALFMTVETDPFLAATADAYRHIYPLAAAEVIPVSNAALIMCLASGEITTGNSPLKLRLRYRTVALTW